MKYLFLLFPISIITYLFIKPLFKKKMSITPRPIINCKSPGMRKMEVAKKYFRKPKVDTIDAIQFDGTNQNEILTFTNSQIIPIEGENVMKDTYEYASITYLYEGNYVCHFGGDYRIVPKREFEEMYSVYEG